MSGIIMIDNSEKACQAIFARSERRNKTSIALHCSPVANLSKSLFCLLYDENFLAILGQEGLPFLT
jgi:hypothetical protein